MAKKPIFALQTSTSWSNEQKPYPEDHSLLLVEQRSFSERYRGIHRLLENNIA